MERFDYAKVAPSAYQAMLGLKGSGFASKVLRSEVRSWLYCPGAKYPLRALTCRSFFREEISMER